MSFEAAWFVFTDTESVRSAGLVVDTDADVDTLVRMMSEPGADTATIYLSGHGALAGPPVLDHAIHAVVRNGHGYLSHWDLNNDLAYSRGLPESPGLDSESEDFPAGSGLSVESFSVALKELLREEQRPRIVEWTPAR